MLCVWDRELWLETAQYAMPNILVQLVVVLPGCFGPIFIGHGANVTPELIAGAGLGGSIVNIAGLSLGTCFCNALDTVIPQAFGAGHPELCAVYLMRVRVVMVVMFLFLAPLMWNAEALLLMLGQDAQVAMHAGQYIQTSMWGVLPYFLCSSARKFLRNVGLATLPANIIMVVSACHLIWLYVFVTRLGWQTTGLATANNMTYALSYLAVELALWIYAPTVGIARNSLVPTLSVLRGMSDILRIGMWSVIQSCAEWWFWELMVVIAGRLGPVQQAAFVDAVLATGWAARFYVGAGTATILLVGKEIGRGDAQKARDAARVGVLFGLLVWTVPAMLFVLPVSRVFTSSADVQDVLDDLLPIAALLGFTDSISYVLGAVLRALDKTKAAGGVVVGMYYVFCLPLMLWLAFTCQLGVVGMTKGFLVGSMSLAVVSALLVAQDPFQEAVNRTLQRLDGHSSYQLLNGNDKV